MKRELLQERMHARKPQMKIAVLGATPIDAEKLIEIVEDTLCTPR